MTNKPTKTDQPNAAQLQSRAIFTYPHKDQEITTPGILVLNNEQLQFFTPNKELLTALPLSSKLTISQKGASLVVAGDTKTYAFQLESKTTKPGQWLEVIEQINPDITIVRQQSHAISWLLVGISFVALLIIAVIYMLTVSEPAE